MIRVRGSARRRFSALLVAGAAIWGVGQGVAAEELAARVSFQREIRPILSDKCFACHGPDANARQAQLRLDERESALAPRAGRPAVVPGDERASEMIARIASADPDERMPPPAANKTLSPREVELLRAWIRQGAEYEGFWAFKPLTKPVLPPVSQEISNPLDALVAARLQAENLQFAPEAEPEVLLRRVTFDLTGLPPTLQDWAAFQNDLAAGHGNVNEGYERAVDRLLASPHFGEHLAVGWLDAARYADTNGYFSDKPRQMWLWRDWVIQALNANLPYDRFTIEQLAGDLLPQPTIEQRIATGFNRNHMANNETGIIDEEFRTEYVVDRVHTTMTAWLGLSAGCAQCHDHKFDPISQREFYQLFAFFNNVPETGLITADNPPPLLEVPTAEQTQKRGEVAAELQAATQAFEPLRPAIMAQLATWEAEAPERLPEPPAELLVLHEPLEGGLRAEAQVTGTTLSWAAGVRGQAARFDATQHVEATLPGFDPDGAWSIGFWLHPDGSLSCPLSLIEAAGDRRGIELIWGKGLVTVHLVNRWGVSQIEVATVEPMSSKNWHHLVVSYDGSRTGQGVQVFVDGAAVRTEVGRDSLQGSVANSEPLRIGRRDSGLGFYGLLDEVRILQRDLDEAAVRDWFWSERIRGILAVAPADRSSRDADELLDYYLGQVADPAARAARQRVKAAVLAEQQLRASIPTVLVMQEQDSPRVTRVLDRGQYDKPGEVVSPGVPAAIAPWPSGEPLNRLGFARWLVATENPLTPRVAVNRIWQHCFGAGLVRTVDDFGSQGEPPSHPELLDWLAATFREEGWDVKRLVRRIVTSRTYRQRSEFTLASGQVVDPENRLLARGPSQRLSAEMLRDQALAVSGLLVRQIGGPSVRPYQPPGLWEAVSYNGEETYVPDTGAGLWRRGIYTFVKRQAPPPGLLILDGPTREKCTMRRPSTNTPLQALVLLNDPTFVESARELAGQVLAEEANDEGRLQRLWRIVLLREPQAEERELLGGLLARQRARLAADPAAVERLLAGVEGDTVPAMAGELAAWTVIAQTVMNLDEAITKR